MVNPLSLYLKDVLGIKSLIWPERHQLPEVKPVDEPKSVPSGVSIGKALQVEDGGMQAKASIVFLAMKTARSSLFAEVPYGLFRKMRAAMKLDPLTAPLIEIDPKLMSEELDFSKLEEHLGLKASVKYVFFSNQLVQKVLNQDWSEGDLEFQQERQCLCTFDPRVLLKSPAKKREAWDDLQKIMRG